MSRQIEPNKATNTSLDIDSIIDIDTISDREAELVNGSKVPFEIEMNSLVFNEVKNSLLSYGEPLDFINEKEQLNATIADGAHSTLVKSGDKALKARSEKILTDYLAKIYLAMGLKIPTQSELNSIATSIIAKNNIVHTNTLRNQLVDWTKHSIVSNSSIWIQSIAKSEQDSGFKPIKLPSVYRFLHENLISIRFQFERIE